MKLFLDDVRIPKDAIGLVPDKHNQFYFSNDWDVVTNYNDFVDDDRNSFYSNKVNKLYLYSYINGDKW